MATLLYMLVVITNCITIINGTEELALIKKALCCGLIDHDNALINKPSNVHTDYPVKQAAKYQLEKAKNVPAQRQG